MQVLSAATLINGLSAEFADTYSKAQKRASDSRLSIVMDMGKPAKNRYQDYAYFEAAPHVELWPRGDEIPQDAMGSVKFRAVVNNWGRRIAWHQDDREDDQTSSMMDVARMTGDSMGLLPERMFFDLLGGTTLTLPAVPTAPDGAAFFATTAGGSARFGVTSGNLLTGSGIASVSAVLADYYTGLEQFIRFQDGKGQPLFSPEVVAGGVLIIHSAEDTQIFETAFLQKIHGTLGSASGSPSNIVHDSSRNVQLWGSPRIATGDWYMFLLSPPKKATFELVRRDTRELTSLAGGGEGDQTRTTGEEYIQWDARKGIGLALPYSAIKVNN